MNRFLLIYLKTNVFKKKAVAFTRSTEINFKGLNFNKFLLFIDLNNIKRYNEYYNYQQFNLYYLKNIYNINLKEKSINAKKILPSKLIKHTLFKTKNLHYKRYSIKYFNEVAYMFLVNIWLKNSKVICRYIKTKLDTVHFKRHRGYFLFFFRILTKYILPNFKILQIKGITLKFKGKLGRGGNARKRTMFYHKGYYSLSNKLLALNRNTWDVWTKTGTVGCNFQIFYNKYDRLS